MTRAGGWTPFETKISSEEMTLFNDVTENIMGVRYVPLAVSTQVVAGTNYSFFCNATIANATSDTYAAMVEVYQQLDGTVHLTEIKRVEY